MSYHNQFFKYCLFTTVFAFSHAAYSNPAQHQFFYDKISKPHHEHTAVVPGQCSGRFGDTLVTFAHALYVAFKHTCEMLYRPFQYSDQLAMHDILRPYTPEMDPEFENHSRFDGNDQQACLCGPITETLVTVPYFTEGLGYPHGGFYTDWKDPIFNQLLKTLIAPKTPRNLIQPPTNQISVALHIRMGGSFESWPDEAKHSSHLYKIPRFEFYVEQLKLLFELVNQQPLYVFVFTDDENPERLVSRLKKAVRINSISYEYRTENNHHNTNVLEDFFPSLILMCSFALTQASLLWQKNSEITALSSRLEILRLDFKFKLVQ